MKNNIKEYLDYHKACGEGLEWCMENCIDMYDVWQKLQRHDWMLWLISDAKCLTDRECHEFGLWCVEQIQHLMTDDRSIAALKAKRDWLDGKITDEELAAVRKVAWGVWKAGEAGEAGEAALVTAGVARAAQAADKAAQAAAWGAAMAARTEAWAREEPKVAREAGAASWAAGGAVWTEVGSAAWEAACEVGIVARDAVEKDQLAWLRANTKPVFRMEDA